MITMLLTSIILAVLGVGTAIWKTKELPESISAMVYQLKGGYKWLWTIWLWLVSFLMAPALMEALPDEWRFLGFLTLVCLLMTGAMPIFMKEKRKAHYAMGIAAGVLSQLCVLAICPWWLMVWVVMVYLVIDALVHEGKRWYDGKAVFIIEYLCAMSLYGSVVIQLF